MRRHYLLRAAGLLNIPVIGESPNIPVIGESLNIPVIGQAWKGRFLSTRGITTFRRGVISLLTISLEFFALLRFCGERGIPLSRGTATLPRQGLIERR